MSATTTTTTTTTSSDRVPRGDVTASINFFSPPADGAIPYNLIDATSSETARNYGNEPHDVFIRDIRGRDYVPTLDHDAFRLLQSVPPSKEKDFVDDESIKANYYPEVEKLLLDNVPGSNRIYLFDHTVRRSGPDAKRSPVQVAHIDQTARSVEKRVRRYYSPEEAEALLKGRYRIINVWRSLNDGPIESFPLAFASSAALSPGDVVPIEHRYKDGYTGETAGIKYNPAQEWNYVSGMTGDERLLIECFDSESLKEGSTIGGRVPHTAFVHPKTREDAVGRESIEVRALVFGP